MSDSSKSDALTSRSPIRRSPSSDSIRLSSAFSRMLLSPVSFTPVKFEPSPCETFRQSYQPRQPPPWSGHTCGGGSTQQVDLYNTSPGDVVSVVGSLFGEVTPGFPFHKEEEQDDAWWVPGIPSRRNVEHDETALDPQVQPYTSAEECTASTTDGSQQLSHHGLPKIVVLPVPEDDMSNPFLSPSYHSSSPPHCVGVQQAAVSHVNGVYLLSQSNGGEGKKSRERDEPPPPPLYFRDGPPVLLDDGHRYDMCILRIDCPDSDDHVIWFLARVDVDPECLDVRFSDCYYYCRMLRSDDGGIPCQSPPAQGWNVPKQPPGVEMSRIVQPPLAMTDASDGSALFLVSEEEGCGLGTVPRQNTVHGSDRPEFISPGVQTGVSKCSI